MSYRWNTNDFYKDGYFYFGKGHGNGDLLYNTCRKIIEDGDVSWWAWMAWYDVGKVLKSGKRWPDEVHHKIRAREHTNQGNLTRDPYWLWYACGVHLYKNGNWPSPMVMERHKPQWWVGLFDIKFWQFSRAMRGKRNFYHCFPKKDPAKMQCGFRAWLEYFSQTAYNQLKGIDRVVNKPPYECK